MYFFHIFLCMHICSCTHTQEYNHPNTNLFPGDQKINLPFVFYINRNILTPEDVSTINIQKYVLLLS